ncbi:MAG: zf-HC2 domain-containing protein [Burkholderiales bacterium]|nr:zf-HC2 domain-containing protein [Burkholderiales bacterium]
MKPWLSCRQATMLAVLQRDRSLGWLERLRLRMHLAMCQACTRFVRQQDLINGAMGPWRAYRDSDERERDDDAKP